MKRGVPWILILTLLLLTGCANKPQPGPATGGAIQPASLPVTPASPSTSMPEASPHTTPSVAGAPLTEFHMVDAQTGWGIGGGKLLRTTDGGQHWVVVSPAAVRIPDQGGGSWHAAYFPSADIAWLAYPADSGHIKVLRAMGGGGTWRQTTIDTDASGAWLSAVDATHVWVLVTHGVAMGHAAVDLYRSDNAGADWQHLCNVPIPPAQSSAPCRLPGYPSTGLAFSTANVGWVAAESRIAGDVELVRTVDGGRQWQKVAPVAVPADLRDHTLTVQPPSFFGARDVILPVVVDGVQSTTIFYASHDGGDHWEPSTPVPVRQAVGTSLASFADPSHGWTLDGTKLYATRDGGQHWASLDSSLAWDKAIALQFVTPDLGYVLLSAGETSHLYATHDGGTTWQELTVATVEPEPNLRPYLPPEVACHLPPVYQQNLQVAAAAKLPVPTTIITEQAMPGLNHPTSFAAEVGTAPTLAAIRERQAAGETWEVAVSEKEARLIIHKPARGADSVLHQLWIRVARGSLGEHPSLATVVDAMQAQMGSGGLGLLDVTVDIPQPPPTQWQLWYPLDLPRAVDQYPFWVGACVNWEPTLLPAYRDGRIVDVPVMLAEMGNGGDLGFAGTRFVTRSIKSGFYVVTWYDIPGLNPIDASHPPR